MSSQLTQCNTINKLHTREPCIPVKNHCEKYHNGLNRFMIFVLGHIQSDCQLQEAHCMPETLYSLDNSSMYVHVRELVYPDGPKAEQIRVITIFPPAVQNRWGEHATGQTVSSWEVKAATPGCPCPACSPRNCPKGQVVKVLLGGSQEAHKRKKEIKWGP